MCSAATTTYTPHRLYKVTIGIPQRRRKLSSEVRNVSSTENILTQCHACTLLIRSAAAKGPEVASAVPQLSARSGAAMQVLFRILDVAVSWIGLVVYLKVASKNARALAREMQTTQTTRTPYTISHLGSFCSARGLRSSEKNIHCLTNVLPH